ncbi:phosphotransferase enzyme family protein [Paenibacillus sp. NPDC057967]|uniref:phosphotransferase enzyme family protein n=1 Tax=Paenibacillus sp. NPDC057967 TaxID=3346293 RepID=UPI0036DB5A80
MNEGDLAIAMEALRHYAIQADTVELIGQSANTVFKVTDRQQSRYSLRLHASKSESMDPIWLAPRVISSELAWLEELSGETDVVVPVPRKNSSGEYVTETSGKRWTLLGWMEGEQKPFIATAEEAGQIGRMMGRLHRQASGWKVPDSFSRPAFDGSRIEQALGKVRLWSEDGRIPQENVELLKEAGQRVLAMMNSLDRTPEHWGIIHADLIPSNLLFGSGECRPIDFGACGFGYFLFDLGWTFSYIHPALRACFLEAYSEQFSLPEHHVERLEGFLVAAQLETMNFWLGLPDASAWLPDHIDKLTHREFRHYVDGDRFLFTGTPYWE